MQSLLDTLPGLPKAPTSLSKSDFAREMGVTPGRISQLIPRGLPVLPNGRIDPEAGREWYAANVDPSRRRAVVQVGEHGSRPVSLKDEIETERLAHARMRRLHLEKTLVDRQAVEAAVFSRARAERDAHLAWVVRVAPLLAGQVGCDPATAFAFLDREMRAHLAAVASRPMEGLADA
jgi:hypothetical protein